MDLLDNPLLRRTLAPQPGPDPHAEPRKRLLDALLQMRKRAEMLAGEIHRDLPDFTVHDITHLDALSFNLHLIQDRKFAQLWVQGASGFEGMDEVDRYRFKSLLVWWLIHHENIFYQHAEKLVDDAVYIPWDEDLKEFVRIMNLKDHWPGLRGVFQAGFADHVDELISGYATHP